MAQQQQQEQPLPQHQHQQPQQHQQRHEEEQLSSHEQLQQQLSEATIVANAVTAITTSSSNSGSGTDATVATEVPPNNSMVTDGIGGTDNDVGGGGGGGGGGSDISGGSGGSSSSSGSRPPQVRVLLPAQASQESGQSSDEPGNACRICRVHRSDMEIIDCPCRCKGSVGHIHLMCLKRWIIQSGYNRCEVCNAPFNLTADRASFRQMVRAFCCGRCCGMILKHILFSASLMPLAHVILQQVLHCMDNMNQGSTEQLSIQEVFVASCALLTSSALFFHFFEFVTTRFLLIRNILRHWWLFGSTNDFGLVEVEDDIFDLF